MADDHRCRPALHRLRGGERIIPNSIRRGWAGSFRTSTLAALAKRAELARIARDLAEADIPMVALKGAWLAWTAYPEPGMRPLRDLDILVPQDRALEARTRLLALGYEQCEETALPLEEWTARFKHLPALASREGHVVEIHTRLWDDDGRMPSHPIGLLERRVESAAMPGLFVLSPIDNVMHLAVHAAFHRFDGGPLMLLDFATLAEKADALDLPTLWDRAAREGWARHAALCINAADRWTQSGTAEAFACPVILPEEMLSDVPTLIGKPLDARESDIATAKLTRRDIGVGEKLRRVLARRERYNSLAEYGSWVGGEVRNTFAKRATPGDRMRHDAVARLDDWLRA
ncbi:nucleotidyltransferase domain-containing protein [Qipengyuania sp. 902]|uniref:nucleotidyltransferase domain-containing protein n=1 Tax=Qipengyuania sp. 902 TaxID=3417565 RepID=UPI003EBEBB68